MMPVSVVIGKNPRHVPAGIHAHRALRQQQEQLDRVGEADHLARVLPSAGRVP